MALGHNSLKRITRRCWEELRATKDIAGVVSLGAAGVTFVMKAVIQAINRGWLWETPVIRRLLLRKHDIMRKYFDNKFASFLERYDYDRQLPTGLPEYGNRIWICWWQGVEAAPEITKKCIESVRKNAGDHKVEVITEENYKQYVQIPLWLEEKYKAGVISRTHYSDVLRLFLLANYGGLWLDATILCVKPELTRYMQEPVWTMKRPDYGHLSVAGGRFVTGCMGCDWAHRWIFATIRDFLLHYWEQSDLLIDYLVLDYLIDLAMRRDARIAACFDSIKPNNPQGDELLKLLGQPFECEAWKNLESETALFILSWKRKFPEEKNGNPTFFSMVLENDLAEICR